jgi:hypothetical protein
MAVVAVLLGIQAAFAWWAGRVRGLYWLAYLWTTLWLGTRHVTPAQAVGGGLLWLAVGMALYTATTPGQKSEQRFSLRLGVVVCSVTGLVILLFV